LIGRDRGECQCPWHHNPLLLRDGHRSPRRRAVDDLGAALAIPQVIGSWSDAMTSTRTGR